MSLFCTSPVRCRTSNKSDAFKVTIIYRKIKLATLQLHENQQMSTVSNNSNTKAMYSLKHKMSISNVDKISHLFIIITFCSCLLHHHQHHYHHHHHHHQSSPLSHNQHNFLVPICSQLHYL